MRSFHNEKVIISLQDWFSIQARQYIKDFEKDKSYVLLYFYSTNCLFCVEEISLLENIAKKYHEIFLEKFPIQVFLITQKKENIPEKIIALDTLKYSSDISPLTFVILFDKFQIAKSHFRVNPNHYFFVIDSALTIDSKASHDKKFKDILKERLGYWTRKPNEQIAVLFHE